MALGTWGFRIRYAKLARHLFAAEARFRGTFIQRKFAALLKLDSQETVLRKKSDPVTGAAWTPRRYGSWPLLVKTGRMYRSIGARVIGKNRVIGYVGGRAGDYAWRHQYGVRVHQRRFMGLRMSTLRMYEPRWAEEIARL